ncbi:FxLYD domain-containing protein [Micromonospora sp. NPDC047730]|uniref:FxLYD domain-containing protein n=1 Tax=Micromonospora sp. NPDC047730 TaxID=3364253 RepID=UPI00371BB160
MAHPYPPPAHPPYGPPTAPKRQSFWASPGGIFLIIFGSLALVGLICGGVLALGKLSSDRASGNLDAQVTSCNASSSVAEVGVSVKNNGRETVDARVRFEYRDATGARLDTDSTTIRNITPGDTARANESTFLDAPPGSTIECRIVGVSAS